MRGGRARSAKVGGGGASLEKSGSSPAPAGGFGTWWLADLGAGGTPNPSRRLQCTASKSEAWDVLETTSVPAGRWRAPARTGLTADRGVSGVLGGIGRLQI